jgi:hypothetical protein
MICTISELSQCPAGCVEYDLVSSFTFIAVRAYGMTDMLLKYSTIFSLVLIIQHTNGELSFLNKYYNFSFPPYFLL